jgi:cytochrome P450
MRQLYPPGPRSLVPGSALISFRLNPIKFLTTLASDYGDIAYFGAGSQHYFFINNPDFIKAVLVTNQSSFKKGRGLEQAKRMLGNGLLTSEGEFHHRQRRLAQPAFHRDRIARYAETMTVYADRLQRERWNDDQTVDIANEMTRLTLAIVGKTLFGTETEDDAEQVRKAVSDSMGLFRRYLLPFSELLYRLPLPSNRRYREARQRLDAIIYGIIRERRKNPVDCGDLLSMLLMAQDEEGDGGQMTDTQLRDEAITIFLAGHETTANALTWTWYLLSQHQEIYERLHAEVDRTLCGRIPTADDFPRLRLVEMALTEAMRLYPPVWVMGRRALHDCEVGGYTIPAGAILLMSQYVMHHDTRYFPDPHRFDPDRWTPEARASRPQFSYFPFGGGTRRCIGEGFAWMEGVLILATIAQKWRLRLEPNQRIEMQPLITLRPKYPIRMKLQRRQSQAAISGVATRDQKRSTMS